MSLIERKQPQPAARFLCAVALLGFVGLLTTTGCSRQSYRLAADRDAYHLLQTRQFDERWKIPFRSVEPDPTSRLADINDPDCGPKPPDDPSSEGYMRHPYRSKEVKYWDKMGTGGPVDSEHWMRYLPYNEDGEVVITKELALDLALTHNRDFQSSVESLYLQALGLSGTRFAFDVNWGGGTGVDLSASGAEGVPRTIPHSSNLGASRNFAAGGQLVANFVNSFTYQVGGGESNFAASSLLFSLTQPLLRNAFRHVRTEGLTQSERSLLYSVRDFAHFRREFYQRIVNQYLNLLVQSQQIRIEEENLRNLKLNLDEHELLQERELVSQIQVDSVFQSYQSGRISLIGTKNSLQSSMDQFKFELGLPAKVKIKIDESLLSPFTINSPAVERLQADADKLQQSMSQFIPPNEAPLSFMKESYSKLKKLQARTIQLVPQVRADFKKWEDLLEKNKPTDETDVDQGLEHKYQTEIAARMRDSFKLFDERLEEVGKKIRESEIEMLKEMNKGIDKPAPDGDEGSEPNGDQESDEKVESGSDEESEEGEGKDEESAAESGVAPLQMSGLNLPDLGDLLEEEEKKTPAVVALNELESLITKDLQGSVSTLFVTQAQIRLFLIEIKTIDLKEQDAVELALRNRLDLMNQRAQVVDAYRGVEIAADALQSGLDLSASARLGTDAGRDNGFRLDGESSSYNVGLQLDGPLNRMSERNSYRGAQISYQSARRGYMSAEDSVVNGIRSNFRSLTALRFNFQTTRQQLIAATRQVDQARLALRQANSGDSSLTQDLLRSLNGLRSAKNGLISSWLNYETSRIGLFVDLELLLLDEGGKWINEDEELNLSVLTNLSNEAILSGEAAPSRAEMDDQPSLGSDEPNGSGERIDNGTRPNDDGIEPASAIDAPFLDEPTDFETGINPDLGYFDTVAPPRPSSLDIQEPRTARAQRLAVPVAEGPVEKASSVGGSTRRPRDWHLGDQ